jgi:UDP-3-O-[3-hydroxymyristoyl] glucosamine N-acyltransferase
MKFKANTIAEFLKGQVEGDPEVEVTNISKIEEGKPGTLAFLANPKYEKYIYETEASIVLVNKDFKAGKKIKATLIRVENAYESFAGLLELYQQAKPQKMGIHATASIHNNVQLGKDLYIGDYTVIEENARLGDNVKLYPQVYIGEGVEIGEGTVIYAGVKVYEGCKIGKNCVIHSGVVIGADGFGFAPQSDNNYRKIPQIGIAILEDNVEIGANSCVDRATMGATILHRGVKLDNFIQIAHNVEVGENTVMAAQSGIAGSTKIGKNCMIAAQVGIAGHIKVGDEVKIGAQSGVMNDVEDKGTVQGSPAIYHKEFWKNYVVSTKLPEMRRQISQLERDMKNLNQKEG